MNHQLVESIRSYFDIINGPDTAGITDYFTQDAVVVDEGNVHRGHGAIRSWLQETRKRFEYSVEPIDTSRQEEHVTVVAKVFGNFPGSPVQLNHSFQLEGDRIQSLEIKL
jgi:ketosteroid isomerase-like protein